ncbi:TGS domain-containing protein, partial [Mycobacterium tuberculosis]
MKLQFPDGAVRDYENGLTARAVAEGISPSLAKRAALARIDGELRDLDRPIDADAKIEFLMRDDPAVLDTIRHDASHV